MEGGTANEENCATSNSPSDFDYPQPRVPDFERIQNARNRRKLQIKEWQQYDRKMMRESEKLQRKGLSPPAERGFFRGKQSVKFPQSLIFLEAAARGDLEEVRKLLSEGVCPNVANENGLTALHQCCIDNTREMCLLLLRFGADPNARDTEQWTPLHAAATCNHTDLCGILIAHNADLLAMNADGNMPYECCMPGPTLNLIETEMDKKGITQEQLDDLHRLPECQMLNDMVTLCKSGADLNALDSQGASWLHIAAASGFEDVTLFLIKNGAKVDLMDKDGWQAIHIAACWDHLEIIEILVNCGANIMAETTSGETVFDICEDLEMHARLNEIKEEMERRKTRQSTPSHSDRPRESVRRRSGTNPRSASIRRTSMREKKLISWKEAKQEAEMRGTSQLDVAESEPPMGADKLPIKPTEPSHDRRVTSPLAVGSPDIKQPPGQQHQLTPSISGPEHINRTPSPAVDRVSQNDDPGWSPRLRMSHPSTSANGLIRPSNGTTSAVRNLTRPVDGNISKPLTEDASPNIEQHSQTGPDGDRLSGRRNHASSLSGSRERPVPPPVPQPRANQTRSTVTSEWHPIPVPSPVPKPRTVSKDRGVTLSTSGGPDPVKISERVSRLSPPVDRRSDSFRRAPIIGLICREEMAEDAECTSPNLSAHNAYYSPSGQISSNHTSQTQLSRTSSVQAGAQSSLLRPKKQSQTKTSKPTVITHKPKMSLIDYGATPHSSGKCCNIM